MSWTTPKGFNFRSTIGYVTDGANQIGITSSSSYDYPANLSIGGETVTCGFTYWSRDSRDRSTGVDVRLAGIWMLATGLTDTPFRVDLPSTGMYRIRIAAGDASYSNNAYFTVYDNTTAKIAVSQTVLGSGEFMDASGVTRTSAADWVSNNAYVDVEFSTTTFFLTQHSPADQSSVIAHLSIEQLGGGASSPKRSLLLGIG